MKKLILSLFVISNASFATVAVSGAQTFHNLKCSTSIITTLGSEVSLQVTTQALAPQYSVRTISVSTKPIYPIGLAQTIALKEESQNAYNAVFEGKDIKVLLDKSTFSAELNLGAITYTCK